MASTPLTLLALVGAGTLAWRLLSLCRVLVHVVRELLAGNTRASTKSAVARVRKQYYAPGSWAIVTGASDGIGREFALQLAQAGFNICLCARSRDKLEQVAGEIKQHQSSSAAKQKSLQTRVVCIDFGQAEESAEASIIANSDHSNGTSAHGGWAELKQAIDEMGGNIAVLVNNVGSNHSFPVPFRLEKPEVIRAIVNVNIAATLRITHLVTSQFSTLSDSAKRQRRLILNVGSFAGLLPQPLLSVYSASKAFLLVWSQALGKEFEEESKSGGVCVDVELVNTYFVVSNMSKIRKASFTTPTPSAFVTSVLRNAGNHAGGASTPYTSSPYSSHAIMNWFVDHVGTHVLWLNAVWKIQSDIRRRALRKFQREQTSRKSN